MRSILSLILAVALATALALTARPAVEGGALPLVAAAEEPRSAEPASPQPVAAPIASGSRPPAKPSGPAFITQPQPPRAMAWLQHPPARAPPPLI